MQTYEETGHVVNTYTYGVQRIKSEGEINETYLYDGHGSVSGVVNEASEVTTYAYTAYGDLLPNSPTPNTFGYNAEATDFNTGLQYLRARYYNTDTGRFISKDNWRGEISFPKSLNRFSYCYDNPVLYKDSSGENPLIAVGALVGAIVGAGSVVVGDLLDDGQLNTSWNDYVSAAVGGAVTGAIIGASGGTAIAQAAYIGAAAESLTSEGIKYAFEGKELTGENIGLSIGEIVVDTVVNGTITFAAGKVGSTVFPTNSGWFKPQTFLAALRGKYAAQLFFKPVIPTLTTLVTGNRMEKIAKLKESTLDIIDDIFNKDSYTPYEQYRPSASPGIITSSGAIY